MDGYVRIGTILETDNMDRDLQKLYDKLQKEQQKEKRLLTRKQKLDIDISKYESQMDKAKEKTNELAEELDRIAKEQLQIDNMPYTEENLQKAKDYLSSLTMSDDMKATQYQDYLLRAEPFQKISQEFDKFVGKIDDGEQQLNILNQKYEDLDMQIQTCERDQARLNQQIADTTTKGFNLDGIGKGFSKIIQKVGELAMALVGVRTVINLITGSFNTLAEYNEELGTKVDQMRLVLAVALEPIINWLISALEVVLSLINQIYMAFTGINLYGRASELWSEKMAKNMSSSAGSARDMRKQLAGFDEMNVLQDNVAGTGGGGGKFTDWGMPQEEIPEWLNWVLRNGEPLGAIMGGVAGGALLMLDGLTKLYFGLQEYDKDPTLENFGEVIHRFGESITGLGMLTMDYPTVLAGAFIAISGILTKNKNEVYKWVDDITSKIFDQANWLSENVSSTLGTIWESVGIGIKYVVDDFYDLIKEVKWDFDEIRKIIDKFIHADLKGSFNEASIWLKGKFDIEKDRFSKMIDFIKTITSKLFLGIMQDVSNVINFIIGVVNNLLGIIQNVFNIAVNWIGDKLNYLKGIFNGFGFSIGDTISGAIKGAVNGALNFVEGQINTFIRMINNVVSVINKIPGVSIGRLNYISLPRLASGGIINQPGRGVPVGGAIAGESGREGILPLTKRQAMAELGKEIGKWININATIPVNIGNRQVARVLQEISADREFAMNS